MDFQQVKVAKAVATHTEHAWAQAYNAGKLYLTISVFSEEKGVASTGKELLERVQREFFAVDEKNLESVKKAVATALSDIPEGVTCSLALATPVDAVLYIITYGSASVLIHRGQETHGIVKGNPQELKGLSGTILPSDIFTLATEDFLKNIGFSKISSAITIHDPETIAESLAPILTENATGLEAGLFILFPQITGATENQSTTPESETEEESVPQKKKLSLPTFSLPNIKGATSFSRKKIAILTAVILCFVLIGGVYFEYNNRTNTELDGKVNAILEENEQSFEDANAILALNRSLAVEEFISIKKVVEKELDNFPEGSSQRTKLQEFLDKVESIINGGGGTAAEATLFFDEKNVKFITFKGGKLIGVGSDGLITITEDGKLDDDFAFDKSGIISSNDQNAYVYSGSSIYRVSKSNGNDTEIINDLSGVKSFDVFGNNVYTLSSTINRYRANSFNEENYLEDGVSLSSPTSMSIDSSIWVIDSGKIRKFTKGVEDSFSIKSELPLSTSAIIYTDEDYDNLYILDPEKKFIAIIDKEGNPVKNLELTKVPDISSFAANEKDSKIFVTSDGKVYSIDF